MWLVPKFWDLMLEILGLFLDSPEMCVKMDFVPRTEVHGFCCMFGAWGCFCDSPKPGGPINHRQPVKTCVYHIIRLIHE